MTKYYKRDIIKIPPRKIKSLNRKKRNKIYYQEVIYSWWGISLFIDKKSAKMKFKIENLKSYTVIPNKFLQDKRLTLKAKGLLATFYSLPNNWDYTVNGLCKITNTGIRAIRTAIMELEIFGYLTRKETRNENGQFDYEYIIHLEPKGIKLNNVTCLRRMRPHYNI